MTRDLRPAGPDDLEELGRFLAAGFRAGPAADFAAPDVLRWKFLDPAGDDGSGLPRSFLARDGAGRIIGHVGVFRTSFEGRSVADGTAGTLHMVDWLGSPGHPGVGASLMRMAHQQAPTQFTLGASEAARAVVQRAGYEPRPAVPVYTRVLRPSHRLRVPGQGAAGRLVRLGRDLVGNLRASRRLPSASLELREVGAFGPEVEDVAAGAGAHAILTRRTPARLNHLLAYPRGGITGWHLVEPSGRLRGFAVLSVVPQHGGRVRLGKIADLVLDGPDPSAWHAAADRLRRELGTQGADVAQGFAAPAWAAEGFSRAGFRRTFHLDLNVRDRRRLLPPAAEAVMHLTPLEADYAFT
ncbi:hypothetical protein OJF2_66640 [Aquisphaera giovannonii]|uniref:Uncharacterized protein n=1 Tax=Aquisphaera giovannonii TaxID=406548 RepID=A0A5B9WBT2_9BACT|nr:acetyltransferase [Aquisphaera giovannonii]QEH38066.1 hypothetical protein OJF2_66640 [Aquisphaera giovannonii]